MVSPHLEKIFFHNILKESNYISVCTPRFFDDQIIKKLFGPIKEFYEKYRQVPSLSQVKEIIKIKGLDDVTDEQLDIIWNTDLKEYEDEWLKESTETFIEYQNLNLSCIDLVNYIKTTTVNSENIKQVVQTARDIIIQRSNIDFEFHEGSDFFNPDHHRQPSNSRFSSGYPFIDLVSGGGWAAKTMSVFLGMPKIGKSLWLANIASQSIISGNNTAIITLEMDEPLYIKRLGANLLGIKINEYTESAKDVDLIRRKLKNLTGNGGLTLPGHLLIREFHTSTASVPDIEAHLRKVEESRKMKFKIVIVDYLNILKNWRNPNSENLYMKIKQIAEDLRAMAQRNNWAVITATQVKQAYFSSTDLKMESASESSALAATIDLMFGIIQDQMMYLDGKYKLKLLANRGEGYRNSAKMYNVDYSHMRIQEDPHTAIIEGTIE